MSAIKDGGPAFPVEYNPLKISKPSLSIEDSRGMTLRDYFAAAALKGMLSHNDTITAYYKAEKANVKIAQVFAGMSYEYADAMLAEREKGGAK